MGKKSLRGTPKIVKNRWGVVWKADARHPHTNFSNALSNYRPWSRKIMDLVVSHYIYILFGWRASTRLFCLENKNKNLFAGCRWAKKSAVLKCWRKKKREIQPHPAEGKDMTHFHDLFYACRRTSSTKQSSESFLRGLSVCLISGRMRIRLRQLEFPFLIRWTSKNLAALPKKKRWPRKKRSKK